MILIYENFFVHAVVKVQKLRIGSQTLKVSVFICSLPFLTALGLKKLVCCCAKFGIISKLRVKNDTVFQRFL